MEGATNAVFLTVGQILQTISGALHMLLKPERLSVVMKQLGYRPLKTGGKRGYLVIELNAESVNENKHAMARYVQPPEPEPEPEEPKELELEPEEEEEHKEPEKKPERKEPEKKPECKEPERRKVKGPEDK